MARMWLCIVHIFWQVKFLGSTFRLLPEAQAMAKFMPLDTISLTYVAWEMLVEVRSPMPHPEPAHTLHVTLCYVYSSGTRTSLVVKHTE